MLFSNILLSVKIKVGVYTPTFYNDITNNRIYSVGDISSGGCNLVNIDVTTYASTRAYIVVTEFDIILVWVNHYDLYYEEVTSYSNSSTKYVKYTELMTGGITGDLEDKLGVLYVRWLQDRTYRIRIGYKYYNIGSMNVIALNQCLGIELSFQTWEYS